MRLIVGAVLAVSFCGQVTSDDAVTWDLFAHPATLTRELTGFTRPARSLELSSEVTARVTSIDVDEGEFVAAPEIATVDDARGQRGRAERVVIQLDDVLARRELEVERSLLAVAEALVANAEIAIERAERGVEFRRDNLTRIRELATKGRASQLELDDAQYFADLAEIDLRDAREALVRVQRDVARTQASVARSEEYLRRFEVRAPSGWRVELRPAEPGHLAQPGRTLLRLVDVSTLRIPFRLDERELSVLRESDRVEVRFVAAGERARARVRFVSAEHDPTTQKRLVELEIDGAVMKRAVGEATGGVRVRLDVRVPDASGGFRVPSEFLRRKFEQDFVRLRDGREFPVTRLRREGEDLIVLPAADLPRGVPLVRP